MCMKRNVYIFYYFYYNYLVVFWFGLRLNVPVNNFSAIFGTEPPLPGYYQYFLGGKFIFLTRLRIQQYLMEIKGFSLCIAANGIVAGCEFFLCKLVLLLLVAASLRLLVAATLQILVAATLWLLVAAALQLFVCRVCRPSAPVICIPGSLGAGDSGDIVGPKCRDLTFDESRQCRRCAGVKYQFMPYFYNKGETQPVHLHSLISSCCLDD